ncbi:MAG: leucine--tRNA ligase [Bacteroidetes bacterium]|nr:MAG: leucine--tRNA ligase [Bacteroidota bacterium]
MVNAPNFLISHPNYFIMSEYKPQEIEKKWQKIWKDNQTFKTEFPSKKPKYYVLDMFPYPSGAGLHVGHPLGYIATDIVARYKRLKGYNVLHPMGYDSFGLPAEQYAVQTGQHPAITTENNIARYHEQLDNIGFSYDWSREVRTSNPDFYKWTQWIFVKIFNHWYNKESDKAEPIETLYKKFSENGNVKVKAVCDENTEPFSAQEWNAFSEEQKHEISLKYRLAYLSNTFVNWCPGLGTVLANEEVKDGVSERGGFPVERKEMAQWSMRITAYAERLLKDLDGLDWSDSIKEQQRYWIGKSKGCMLTFQIADLPSFKNLEGLNTPPLTPPQGEGNTISVFTTRVDTIYGVTYLTLAPEHELVDKITTPEQKAKVNAYVHYAKNKSELDRQADVKTVTGEFTGAYAINPLNNALIPIWIGEYVLAGYGTGAVMAVPSSDTRDYAFAKHFNLPIINVQEGEKTDITKEDFDPKAGTMINSDFLNGMDVKSALDAMTKRVEELGVGYGKVNYKIRDSIFSRQRYWGEPIPVYFKNGLPYTLDESQLPLELPKIDEYKPTANGEPPLARAKNWVASSPPLGEGFGEGLGEGSNSQLQNANLPSWQTTDAIKWKAIKEKARELRKNQTDAEQTLWYALRGEQLGVKFRRQQVIDVFIADFVNLNTKLIIEVDGGIHLDSDVKKYDEYRTEVLQNLGYTVVRFTNEEVENHLDRVIEKIRNKISELPKLNPTFANSQKTPPLTNSASISQNHLGEGKYPLETSTMPGWAGSSWYFLRYMDAKNESEFASKDALDYWQDVDLYLGGSEHATGHLLYSRFWHKFLYDLGYVKTKEYAKKLINQGMIQGVSAFFRVVGSGLNYKRDINDELPDDIDRPVYIVSYGLQNNEYIDLIKQDLLKRNPKIAESNLEFNISFGIHRIDITNVDIDNSIDINEIVDFLERNEIKGEKILISKIPNRYICNREVEKMSKSKLNVVNPDDVVSKYGADTLRMFEMFLGPLELSKPWSTSSISGVSRFLRNVWKMFYDESGKLLLTDEAPNDKELKVLHKTIKKVEEDIERFSFNTSVSTFMVCVNELSDLKCHKRTILSDFLIILAPYAPHIAEELWEAMGNKNGISYAIFPKYDEKYLVESSFEYPISINGKVRHKMNFPANMDLKEVENQALASAEIIKWLEGKAPKKVIVVPNKIVNVVL